MKRKKRINYDNLDEELQEVFIEVDKIDMRIKDLQTQQTKIQNEIHVIEQNMNEINRRIFNLQTLLPNNPHINRNLQSETVILETIQHLNDLYIIPYVFGYHRSNDITNYEECVKRVQDLRKSLIDIEIHKSMLEKNTKVENDILELQSKLRMFKSALVQKWDSLREIKRLRAELYRYRDKDVTVKKEVVSITNLTPDSYYIEILVKTFLRKQETVETNMLVYKLEKNTKWFKFNNKKTSSKEITDRDDIAQLFKIYNEFINKNY
jgi:chromosome segregation ATPase